MTSLLLLWPLLAAPADEKFPPELVDFSPRREKPVFEAEPGNWDAKIRERGWIMVEDGLWKLWYTGYDGTPEGRRMLGYATSPDGVQWKRHPLNPLVKDFWVEDMMVVKADGKYHMFAEGEGDRAQRLVSDDGVKWERVGTLDVRLRNGKPIPDGPFGTPTAWLENDIWHLFYERGDKGVWLATSKDLKVFTNVRDEPVLSPGPGEYDKDLVALNQIVKVKDRYYAYYHGASNADPKARRWSVGVAVSKDLIRWEKYAKNPLRPVEENKSSGVVVSYKGKFLLYTMHPAVHVHGPKE